MSGHFSREPRIRPAAPLPPGARDTAGEEDELRLGSVALRQEGCSVFRGTAALPVSVVLHGRLLRSVAGKTDAATTPEAVARSFLESGTASFSTLDGEYALGIVDHRTHHTYLVRDRMGMRPVYWTRTPDGGIAWASECKMLLPLLAQRRLDAAGLAEVLQFRWLAGETTLFAGIRRMLPGSWAVLSRSDGAVALESTVYWRFETEPEPPDRPQSAWAEDADAALARAVGRRLDGASNAAVLLSGGVDSPLLAQHVKRQADSYALITPTWIGHDDPEIPRAVEYGRLIGGDHRLLTLDPADIDADFLDLNHRFEQPARSPHALTLTRVAAELDGFDVVVHGEGADVMFGADGLRLVRNFAAKRRLLDPFGPLPRMLGRVVPESMPRARALRKVLTQSTWDCVRLMGDAEHEPWLAREWAAQGLHFDANPALLGHFVEHAAGHMARRQIIGLYTAALDHMEMMERLYAARRMHVTAPFLSPEIVALARRLPAEYKIDAAGRAKPVLKELSGKYFPPHMAHAKKLGFAAPTLLWLQGPLQPRVERLRAGATPSAALFGASLVRRLSLPTDLQAVWTLVCLDEIMTAFDVEPAIVAG
jgi:asparagine synthase (glutamine-hydrolysing)